MYFEIIQQLGRTLRNLEQIIGKAVRHAEVKKFDPNNFMSARLTPDMLPFPKQVQIACDAAKFAAASLAGKDAPRFDDNEATLPELQQRIQKTLSFLETLRPEDVAKVGPKTIVKIPYPPGKAMHAPEAVLGRAVPNVFFHVTMAYALLRQGGVDIGKGDYLGNLTMFDA